MIRINYLRAIAGQNGNYIVISWSTKSEFGEVTIDPNGSRVIIDSEYLSREFVKDLLCQIVDEAMVLGDPK